MRPLPAHPTEAALPAQRLPAQPRRVRGDDLLMYYERGDPMWPVAPHVFVIFGVPDHHRMSYKL